MILDLVADQIVNADERWIGVVVTAGDASFLALLIEAFAEQFDEIALGHAIQRLQQPAKALPAAFFDIQPETLRQTHDPGEIVLLLFARITGDHCIDATLPPRGATIEIRHGEVAAVAEGRATVASGAVAVHQYVETVHRLYIVGERQMPFERANLAVIDHQHFYPRIIEQVQRAVDPINVGHHRIRYAGMAHVGDAQLKGAAMQDRQL